MSDGPTAEMLLRTRNLSFDEIEPCFEEVRALLDALLVRHQTMELLGTRNLIQAHINILTDLLTPELYALEAVCAERAADAFEGR